MGIKDGEVERIKEGSQLQDLVARDVSHTEPSGDGFMCSSPFRGDRNPSFFVSEARQFWHDFGTGESGDVIAYVRRRDGCGFVDALRHLCETFGLQPLKFDQDGGFNPSDFAARRQLLEIAAKYYEKVLWSEGEHAVKAMMATHGISRESLQKYRAGYADGKLHLHIQDCYPWQFTVPELLSTGLFYQRSGGLKDVFDRRGVFPYLRNNIAEFFIARRYEGVSHDPQKSPWEAAKYKKLLTHSAKYPFVMKGASHPLFGLDTVRGTHKGDILVVTEGVTDAISAMEAGLKVVSPVTVSFRKKDYEPILRIASRFSRVVIFNDLGDRKDAGKKGAVKTAIYLHTNGVDVRLIDAESLGIDEPTKGNKVDLNSFFVEKGASAVQMAVNLAPTLPDFLINEIPEGLKETPSELVTRLDPVFMLLNESDEITRDLLTTKVSKRFGIKKSVVEARVESARLEEPEKSEPKDGRHQDDPSGPNDPFAEPEEKKNYDFIEVDEEQQLDALTRGEVLVGKASYYGYVKRKGGDGEFVNDGDEDQKKGVERISNFLIVPHRKLINEDDEDRLSVYFQRGDDRIGPITVPSAAWSSIAKFREFYCRFGDIWFNGTSDNVTYLKSQVSLATQEKIKSKSTVCFTEHEGERFFVWPGGVLGKQGIVEDPKVCWDGQKTPLGEDLKLHDEEDSWNESQLMSLAQDVLPALMKMNEPEVILMILGWIYACPFASEVKEEFGLFPLFWMWATQGAGKTTIAGIMSKLTGQSGGMRVCSMSSFALTKELSSSTCIPLFLDEYRNDQDRHKRANIHELARITANANSTLAKGTASQELKIYKIGRPLFVGGETPPRDAATLERCLVCNPSKKAVSIERQAIFQEVDDLPLWRLAASFLRFALDKHLKAQFEASRAELLTLEISSGLSGRIPLRNRVALTVMLFGLNQFNNWAQSLGVEMDVRVSPEVFAKIVASCLGDKVEISEDGTTSIPSPQTAVSIFLAEMHTMATIGVIRHGEHYLIKDADSQLFFHFDSVYSIYMQHLRRTGQEDEVRVGKTALRAAIREECGEGNLIINNRKTSGGWSEGGSLTRVCVVACLTKFRQEIKDEEFPSTESSGFHPEMPSDKSWGTN
jgi:DNA primase